MNHFELKQFTIKQDRCAFKVGTDSVLLGAWAKPENAKRVLDIGTGSGILALMMAQKTNADSFITAIDIDEGAVDQATENAVQSPWNHRIRVIHSTLQEFAPSPAQGFDFIISNPPYFNTDTRSSDPKLAQARNTLRLSFNELISGVVNLLDPEGTFSVILPVSEVKVFNHIANINGLKLNHLCRVFTRPGAQYEKRHLMEFSRKDGMTRETTITIEDGTKNNYTDEYKNLTRDFYLKF